jgi:tetratricopeptide (TPR) repeat protein
LKGFKLNSILYLSGLLLSVGCSTEKNTAVTRFYHNLTSHYNIYFNAKESVKEGLKRIDNSVVEDYTHVLPVFPETNPVAARVAAADMEYAIQKCQKLIAYHSLTVKPIRKSNDSEKYKAFASQSDYNKWIDDTYLLMGQANYYLRDFHKAQENFNFILHNFSNQPTRNPAFLWLARCYIETGENDKAIEIFKLLERDGSLPDQIKKDLLLVKADYYILRGNSKESVSLLNQALRFKLNKKEQGRYNFILAQLYLSQGEDEPALQAFNRVVKCRPSYRMAFEAKTSLLELSKGNPGEIDLALAKMIRNGNNHPYLDRLYYAKGVIALKSEHQPEAIRDFQTSVLYSMDNNSQRALSSLTVARLFFEKGNYRQSSCYYDSALAVIDQNYSGYEEIVTKTNGLAALIRNLDLITKEDSLQRVAHMNEKERLGYINKLIAKVTETETLQLREKQNEQNNQSYFRSQQYRTSFSNTENNSLWYFYNPVTSGIGKSEFQQIWGKRKLEDNWRRKNKVSLNPAELEQAEAAPEMQLKELQNPKGANPKSVGYYLQDLPLTDSLMLVSNDRIRSALFAAGRIYGSILNDNKHAIEAFELLNKRYPGSIYELSTWIEFYKMNHQSDIYRRKITEKYPDSNYAKFLLNPDFFKELEVRKQLMEHKYEEAATLYQKGDYTGAGKLVSEVLALQPDSMLLPKVKFIEMIAKGKNSLLEDFSKMLNKYLTDFPDSPARQLVLKIRELIQQNALADLEKMISKTDSAGLIKMHDKQVQLANDPFGGKYSYDGELFHYFVVSFPTNAKVDVNRLIFDIANFNIDYYTSFDFDIEEIRLNDQISMVVIRSLPNKEEGLGYFGNIIKQKTVFKALKGVDYHYFIASSTNYRRIIADQDLLEYLKFFVQNYSKISSPVK